MMITGAVGVPVHELSHALMCLIFGHKITEINLYESNPENGTMGYVIHSYNERNLYHQIGNFFIGIAPILGGSGVLLLLMRIMLPTLYFEVTDELRFVALLPTGFFDFYTYVGYLELLLEVIKDIFHFANMGNILWWIFILLAFMISSHMELGAADIQGGLHGFAYVAGALLVTDIILYFISVSVLEALTSAMTSFALSVVSFLSVSAVFSGIMLLIALAIKYSGVLVEKIKSKLGR
ncbi:MAG: hypothetical protein J6V80_01820 [Clostridia bacterium]|nr:hypothetical protein [Clostridia bacterium]